MNIDSIIGDIDRMARIANNLQRTKSLISTFEEAAKYEDLKNDLVAFAELLRKKYSVITPHSPEFSSKVEVEHTPERCELCNEPASLCKTRYRLNGKDVNLFVCKRCRNNIIKKAEVL